MAEDGSSSPSRNRVCWTHRSEREAARGARLFTPLKKVVLIGGSGQVGLALQSVFASGYDLVATGHDHRRPGQTGLDLGDARATMALLQTERPDLVLLAGAMCHVDRCEQEPDLCRRVNVAGPAAVAAYAREHGSRVVFFSTDHVFDGDEPSYREADAVHPLSMYARSKMEAEDAIREAIPAQHLIIRTGWLYGPDLQRRNFVVRLIDRVRAGEDVDVPSDQWGSPTYTDDLARAAGFLVERAEAGTFHATGPELIDRVALALRVCERFELDPRHVHARPTSALNQPARRSLRVQLDCSKLHETGAPAFRGIAAGLDSLATWSSSRDSGQPK